MGERTITVPDGKGNMVEIPNASKRIDVERKDHKTANENLDKARENDFFMRVGHCTEELHKFLKAYIIDYGLAQEEALAAVYLMNINNREFAPEGAENWKEYYDSICRHVWNWFQEHK